MKKSFSQGHNPANEYKVLGHSSLSSNKETILRSFSLESNKDLLVSLYLSEKLSLMRLSVLYGVSANTIKAHLTKCGVAIRSRKQAMRHKWTEEDYIRKRCSDKELRKFRVGERVILDTGYAGIYSPDPTGVRRYPFLKEHRVLAERLIKRRLRKGEGVHHKDGNKTNNNPHNLYIFPTATAHTEYHRYGYGLFSDLPKRIRIKAKRFLRKYAICVVEFKSRSPEIPQAPESYLIRTIYLAMKSNKLTHGRDNPYVQCELHSPATALTIPLHCNALRS